MPSGAQQHPDYMVNTHKVGQRCIPPQRVKHAVLKWSKHGSTTIFLPDKKHVAGVDIVLLCGDIHPQPGPRIISRRTDKVSASQANKSSTFQASKNRKQLTIAHLNVRSMASRENFHLLKQIVTNYDIFTISETWLDPSTCDFRHPYTGVYVI